MSVDFTLTPANKPKKDEAKVNPVREKPERRRRASRKREAPAQGSLNNGLKSREELGSWLWGAVDILRGAVSADDYGGFVLPLLLYKRLSDNYSFEYQQRLEKYGEGRAARDPMFYQAVVPDGCLWEDVRKTATNVGSKLNDVLNSIAKANPKLDRVINKTDFNNPNAIPEEHLVRLIEHLSQKNLANGNVSPDILGDGYNYLLKKFNEEAPRRVGALYTPREVVKALVSCLKPEEGMEVYDPYCGSGGMLIESYYYLKEEGKDPKKLYLYGQELNENTWAIAKMNEFLHDIEAEIVQGDTFVNPKFLDSGGLKKFDLAVANPRWNQRDLRSYQENDTYGRFTYGLSPNSSADWGWIQHMLASLKDDGRMGIVLDQGALLRGGAEGMIRKRIIEKDLVECVVALPNKLFYHTEISSCFIILNKNKLENRKGKVLFINTVGGFEQTRNLNILRIEDIDLIVELFDSFKDVENLSNVVTQDILRENEWKLNVSGFFKRKLWDNKIQEYTRKNKLSLYPISEVSISINRYNPKSEDPFQDIPNSVYLPIFANSEAVASLSDLKIKPQNYYQIILQSEKALSSYVSEFYNSNMGKNIREYYTENLIIPRLNKKALQNSILLLPKPNMQEKIVQTLTTIRNIETGISTLKNTLLDNPGNIQKIQKELSSYENKNSFIDWLETIPFPLASILWTYNAETDPEKRAYHLLHFFEALAIFNTTVLLSGFFSNVDIKNEYSYLWTKEDSYNKITFRYATFGNWIILGERLAKELRRLYAGKNKRQIIDDMFSNPNIEFINMIISKKLFEILKEGNEYRNLWKGHGGIWSTSKWTSRLTVLENMLSLVRSIIKDNYRYSKLVLPGKCKISSGIHNYEISLIMGTRTPFEKHTINTLSYMNDGYLHLVHDNSQNPMEIIPFIKIMESPTTAQNACYFYNRISDENIRWVSYHFEPEAEIIKPDQQIRDIVDELSG